VSDIAPLTALVKLTRLNVRGCSSVSDLAPLEKMTNLQELDTRPIDDFSGGEFEGEDDGSSADDDVF
jgi:hypothetical protein